MSEYLHLCLHLYLSIIKKANIWTERWGMKGIKASRMEFFEGWKSGRLRTSITPPKKICRAFFVVRPRQKVHDILLQKTPADATAVSASDSASFIAIGWTGSRHWYIEQIKRLYQKVSPNMAIILILNPPSWWIQKMLCNMTEIEIIREQKYVDFFSKNLTIKLQYFQLILFQENRSRFIEKWLR